MMVGDNICEPMLWSRIPMIVILGATGSGKSKLGIELAKRFNGEIISADSMQVYKGLDIVTNKVTPEEQAMAKHHMLDIVDPLKRFTVVDFRNLSLPHIKDIHTQGKLPVVVGGTNYYIESLLWQVLIEEPNEHDSQLMWERDPQTRPRPSGTEPVLKKMKSKVREPCSVNSLPSTTETSINKSVMPAVHDTIEDTHYNKVIVEEPTPTNANSMDWESMSNNELHSHLLTIDPDMANTLHPNNRRKIIRALQVWYSEGRKLSQVLNEQRTLSGGSTLGGPLRFPKSVILWLQCDQSVLDARLDSRVDIMLSQGLLQELKDFHAKYNAERLKTNEAADYTTGIFQSIGFKEFHSYLILPAENQDSDLGQQMMKDGIEALKMATRRYSRKQLRWLNNRVLREDRQAPPVYALDATDPTQWEQLVSEPATRVVEALISDSKPQDIIPLPVKSVHHEIVQQFCETCQRLFVDLDQWNIHLASKKHKREVARKNRKQLEETE